MEVTPQIALYVLLLVPGLLGHAIFCAFSYTEKPTWSGRTVVAIVLSIGSYASLSLLRQLPKFSWLPEPHELLNLSENTLQAALSGRILLCVFMASLLSFVYSLLLVWLHNRQALHRFARAMNLTTKSGYASEWDGVLIARARDRWLMIAMKDGSMFQGWLESHDVASAERCIVLSNVREYPTDNDTFLWPPDDLFVVNDLSDVRFLRLIPTTRDDDEQSEKTESISTNSRNCAEVRESEPQVAAQEPSTGRANQAPQRFKQ